MTTELPRTPGADPTRRVPVAVPRRLGRYELLERIGEGGMGVVWRAVDDGGRQLAVKVLREHIAHDEQARARLRREVHTLARVHHPRVAAVVDADVDGPAPFVVTEYVAGRPLDEVVERSGPLRGEDLLRLGRGLGEALEAIHRAGIVHRDLKPGNVLMVRRADGAGLDPVVIDFGIAQVADDVRLTMTGMVMGTPGYLSPEVVEGGDVGRATDWWGWAATLAYAASGEPPFGRAPMTVVLDRVTRGRLRLDGVDPALRPLLAAALDPDPARRPTQRQLLEGLERYARGEDVTGVLPSRARRGGGGVGAHEGGPRDRDDTRRQPVVDPTRGLPRQPGQVAVPPPHAPRHDGPEGAGGPAPGPYPEPAPAPHAGRTPAAYPGAAPPAQPGADGSFPVAAGEQGGPDPRIGRSRRTGTLAALLVGFVGLASAVPLLAWALFALWGVAARTVDASLTTLVLRRHEAGRRRSDVPVLVAASPWHLTRGVLATMFSLLLPVGLAVLVALVVSGVVTTTETMIGVGVEHPLPIAAGSLVGALLAWWGLSATPLRRGSRTLVRGAAPAGLPTAGLVTLLLVGGTALSVWGVLDAPAVSWWPLPPDFDPRDVLPFRLP